MRNVKELVINIPNFLITDNEGNHIAINVSSILKSLIIESIFIITNQQKRAIAIISGKKTSTLFTDRGIEQPAEHFISFMP